MHAISQKHTTELMKVFTCTPTELFLSVVFYLCFQSSGQDSIEDRLLMKVAFASFLYFVSP